MIYNEYLRIPAEEIRRPQNLEYFAGYNITGLNFKITLNLYNFLILKDLKSFKKLLSLNAESRKEIIDFMISYENFLFYILPDNKKQYNMMKSKYKYINEVIRK